MSVVSRRVALQVLATGGLGAVAAGTRARASDSEANPKPRADAVSMLFDSTVCTGCKACVVACTDANNLPPDTKMSGGIWQMPVELNSETKNIIRLYKDPAKPENFAFVKQQCMHCLDPGCVAACPFHALHKGEKGVVAWDGSLCIGCRYCEVACPFDIPKFEWEHFNPKIVKCEFCNHRLKEGLEPGCTTVCPTGAVIFGKREDLLAKAKERIAQEPNRYYEKRVYGEKDAGGTQVLYLAGVSFKSLGLPDVPQSSIAHYATYAHRMLYRWMLLPLAIYAVLAAVLRRRWKEHSIAAAREEAATGLKDQL